MKRLLIILLILAAGCGISSAQFRWGPTLDINLSNYRFKQKLLQCDRVAGFGAGIMGELMFPGIGLGIDLGLNYSMHGSKLHFGEYPVFQPLTTKTSYLHTLQIPVNLRFKYTRLNGIEDKIAPFVYAGPVFSLTIGHNKIDALEYPGGCIGLQGGIGAEIWRNWQISAGYQWGMTYEVRTRKLDNYSARCSGWKMKVTYLF